MTPRLHAAPLWVLPPLLLLGLVFFYPLSLILAQAFAPGTGGVTGWEHFAHILGTPLFQHALLHTVQIALSATCACLLLGTVLALLMSFVPFPGVGLFSRLIETYIALPTFLLTLAFTFLYGSAGMLNGALVAALRLDAPPLDFLYSMGGVLLAEVTAFTPFVLRPLLASFSQFERAQIEVASSLGARPWHIVRRVILPAALPALLAGGSLCLLLTVNEFGIVLFIGAKGVVTLPMLVYELAIQEGDYVSACSIALVNIVISMALYLFYKAVLGRLGGALAGLV